MWCSSCHMLGLGLGLGSGLGSGLGFGFAVNHLPCARLGQLLGMAYRVVLQPRHRAARLIGRYRGDMGEI